MNTDVTKKAAAVASIVALLVDFDASEREVILDAVRCIVAGAPAKAPAPIATHGGTVHAAR